MSELLALVHKGNDADILSWLLAHPDVLERLYARTLN